MAILAAGAAPSADGSHHAGVGLVLEGPIVSRPGERYVNNAFGGLLRAKRKLHVRAKAVAPSPTNPADLAPYDYLARRGYDLVISLPFIPGLSQAARRFPDVKFVALDGTRQELAPPVAPNVEGTIFHSEQGAYLAGFLAAHVADERKGPHVISSVGGFPEPQVKAFIAGFRAGARRADPNIKLLNGYSYDFVDQARCRHIARLQIAHGSQVVFNVAGSCGVGALLAARQEGVYGVGVDTDQSSFGSFILTSVVLNTNFAVYDIAMKFVHGRLRTGGNVSFDLRDHGVYLGKFSKHVRPALRRQLERLAGQIEQGKIVVPATLSSSR